MTQTAVYWITGLSGAGKTTVATAVKEQLGKDFVLLDGDVMRKGLSKDLGFSIADRRENIRRVAEASKLLADNGKSCICTFISPTQEIRNLAKAIIGTDRFNEIYINTPITICEKRDPKGLYKKVRAGEIKEFTGISSVYEAPESPDLLLDCHTHSIEESVHQLLAYINHQA